MKKFEHSRGMWLWACLLKLWLSTAVHGDQT